MTSSDSDIVSGPKIALLEIISASPYSLSVDPLYRPTPAECEECLAKFGFGPDEKHKRAFWARNFGLLMAMCSPLVDVECFRADWISCLCAFQTLTDVNNLLLFDDDEGGPWANKIAMDALKDLLYYRARFWIGEGVRGFLKQAQLAECSEGTRRRFLKATELYLAAVPQQVEKQRHGVIPGVDEYLALRRETSGLKMCFAIGEFGLLLNLPDVVFEDEMMKTMHDCAIDIVVLLKDMFDGMVEQGNTYNITAVAMQEKQLTVEDALDFAMQLSLERMDLFYECQAKLPSYGPDADQQIKNYIGLLDDWARGETECWNTESQQFCGGQIPPTVQTKVVPFLLRIVNTKSDSAA